MPSRAEAARKLNSSPTATKAARSASSERFMTLLPVSPPNSASLQLSARDAGQTKALAAEDVVPLEARNGDGGEPPHIRQHGDECASAFFNQPWCRVDGMAPDAGQTGP